MQLLLKSRKALYYFLSICFDTPRDLLMLLNLQNWWSYPLRQQDVVFIFERVGLAFILS